MNIRKISAFMVAIMLTSSMCGCKKKVEAAGKMQMPAGLHVNGLSEEAGDDIDTNQSVVDADRILFTHEYRNQAWGYQYTVYVIYGDGRVYYYSLDPNPGFSKDDIDSVIDLSKDQPSFTFDQEFINELYEYARNFDPNAKESKKHSAYDAGQTSLYYWDEDMNKVMLLSEGDYRYEFEDPNFEKIKTLWSNRYRFM